MKIIDVLNRFDDLKPNTYTQTEKIAWLSELDGRVKIEIIDEHLCHHCHRHGRCHDCERRVEFAGYNDETDIENTDLLIPAPYDSIYLYFLETKVNYALGEDDDYARSKLSFNNAYNDYFNYYNRKYRPRPARIRYF